MTLSSDGAFDADAAIDAAIDADAVAKTADALAELLLLLS